MRNHEVLETTDLLNRNGTLKEPGFARKPVWNYNRNCLPVPHAFMKEWDYYLVMSERFGVAFTLSDLGYIRMASVSFLDFESRKEVTKTALAAPSLGFSMPGQPIQGVSKWKTSGVTLCFESASNGKHIYCEWKKFYGNSDFKADLWFGDLPAESMNIATPYENSKHFYLNQKMNAMPCSGKVVFNWHVYHMDPSRDLGVLDWGRGYWPYRTHWYWGTASCYIKGVPFGLNLGYGFGDTRLASENVILYDGKVHKLDDVTFLIPENPMEPWTITSSDGRLEAIFHPQIDRAATIDLKAVSSVQHQYFGVLNGQAVLDDGTLVKMEHIRAAFEDVTNRY